jgi:membrane-bound lytic murein transglycosylase D
VVTKRTISLAFVAWAAACARPSQTSSPVAPAPVAESARNGVLQQAEVSGAGGPVTAPTAVFAARDSMPGDSVAIARRTTELFGDHATPAAAPADATAIAPSWDIEVHEYESTDRVEHYVQLFSGSARERIESRLERGTRYESMIRTRMRAGGIPEDMYYLALIESGFDQNAYSRAAAVGMWQFMTSTARDMGLRVDWWVDERRDPFKSTTAAVRFIKELRDQFGSLYLAAAAYNGGPGRISRGLTRYADDFEGTAGDDLFFALAEKDYLRNETREYVPQLIAAALIAKEPQRYGMKIDPQPEITYDSVRVGPATALAAVAHAADTSVDVIRDLNPHVLRGVTPPKDSFFVRVPTGTADSTAAALADMPKSEKVGIVTVETKKGENFVSVARKSGVSSKLVALYNPKVKTLKSGNLPAGTLLLVPTEAVGGSTSISVPDPEIERYGPSAGASSTTHVVKRGETIGSVARKYGTTTETLMKLNGLKKPRIVAGQSLVVKGSTRKSAARPSSFKTPEKTSRKPSSASKSTSTKKASSSKTTSTKASTSKSSSSKSSKSSTAKKSASSKSTTKQKTAS